MTTALADRWTLEEDASITFPSPVSTGGGSSRWACQGEDIFPPNICSSIRDRSGHPGLSHVGCQEAILLIGCSVCVSEVRLTDGCVLWEAEQCQVPVAAVGSIVIEIGSKVCLCWGRKGFYVIHIILGALLSSYLHSFDFSFNYGS